MAKRKMYVGERPYEDDSRLGRITTKVRTIAVPQMGENPPFAVVQASGYNTRDPHAVDEAKKLRRALLEFEAEIYRVPEGQRWCSHGHWSLKTNFSPKADNHDGLHSICKTCRAEMGKDKYAEKIMQAYDRPVRAYKRKAA
jgi:hypothetical protein